MPSFITLVPTGIQIRTADPDDADDYEITLWIKANGPSEIPAEVEQHVVYNLKVSACKVAMISVDGFIENFTYYIGSGPSAPKGGNFVYDERCTLECSLSVGYPEGPIANAAEPYSFDATNCIVTVDTTVSEYHNRQVRFMLTGTLVESGATSDRERTQVFEVTFQDRCNNVVLSAPTFAEATAT